MGGRFEKRADSTMVLGGRLEKMLTVQWFCEVGCRSSEKVADSTMVLGGRWKKLQPGQWFCEVV